MKHNTKKEALRKAKKLKKSVKSLGLNQHQQKELTRKLMECKKWN